MVTRLLRVVGLLVALWLASVTALVLAAPPLLAVSYQSVGGDRLNLLDLRLNTHLALLAVAEGQAVWDHTWGPDGKLAVLIITEGDHAVWVRSPDRTVAVLDAPTRAAGLNWSPNGDTVVMIHGDALTQLDPATGRSHEQPLTDDLYTLPNVFIPLSSDEVLVQGRRASGELPFYYNLNLQTGDSVQVSDLPCAGNPGSVRGAGDGTLIYTCQRRDTIYLGPWTDAPPLFTVAQMNAPGNLRRPLLSPDGTHVLFGFWPAGIVTPGSEPSVHILRIADGSIRQVSGGAVGVRENARWLPSEAVRRGR